MANARTRDKFIKEKRTETTKGDVGTGANDNTTTVLRVHTKAADMGEEVVQLTCAAASCLGEPPPYPSRLLRYCRVLLLLGVIDEYFFSSC